MDPAQLQQLEHLADQLFTSPNADVRDQAQRSVLSLQSSTEFIPQCQYILDNSENPYAQTVASQSLSHLVQTHWNNFSADQCVDIRNYVLSLLATKGPNFKKFVTASLIKFVCLVTRLGWFSHEKHREFTSEITKFLQATVEHCVIGLQILNELVVRMNLPLKGETMSTHRKCAVSFRDASLLHVFQIALTTLRQLRMGSVAAPAPVRDSIQRGALKLGQSCLQFNFVGTNPDESLEEAGTVQAPMSWRPVFQDPSALTLLVDLYKSSEAPLSSEALELLLLFSSVRRSLFSSASERRSFLAQLLCALRDILRDRQGLAVEENYHIFCRLLGRLKSNYQLSEMVGTKSYSEWIELTAEFTISSFGQWQWARNSTHYLLALWSRLVTAIPYFKPDGTSARPSRAGSSGSSAASGAAAAGAGTRLDVFVPRVFQAYVESCLTSVADVLAGEGSVEDPLGEHEVLEEQMAKLPNICRYHYAQAGEFLVTRLDRTLAEYQTIVRALPSAAAAGSVSAEMKGALLLWERRLAWLVYIVGTIVGGHSTMTLRTDTGDELVDGDMCRRVFQLMHAVDGRVKEQGEAGRCCPELERSLLYFFQRFRTCYIGEQRGMPAAPKSISSVLASLLGTGTALPPSKSKRDASMDDIALGGSAGAGGARGSTAAALAAISAAVGRASTDDSPLSLRAGVLESKGGGVGGSNDRAARYARMFSRMGLGDHSTVINLIMAKICLNLRYWASDQGVIKETLAVLLNLAAGYSSGRFLLGLDATQNLLANHSAEHYAFLAVPELSRHRTTYYTALSRLLVLSEAIAVDLPNFLQPILRTMAQLDSTPDLTHPVAKAALIGCLRDLRGVASSTSNRRTYAVLFRCLHPTFFPLLTRAAAQCFDDPAVTSPLLKLMLELVYNKTQRLVFGHTSANSFLLFRQTSAVLCAYGTRILPHPVVKDAYAERYKGISLALNMLTRILGGNYVNFGVFKLYADPCLPQALEVALQLALSIGIDVVQQFPGVAAKYYVFLEVVFRDHVPALAALDTPVFLTLVKALQQGLNNSSATLSSLSATALDHVAAYYVRQRHRAESAAAAAAAAGGAGGGGGGGGDAEATAALAALTAHFAACPSLFPTLLADLFNMLLFENRNNCWSLARPILSIVLAHKQSLAEYQAQLLASQPPDKHSRLADCFTALMAGTQPNLQPSNRDRFTQRVTTFRTQVRKFLVL